MGWGARFAGVLVASVVLSACGGAGPAGQALPTSDSGASAEPSSTASARPSAPRDSSPSPTPPASSSRPSAAEEKSKEGAQAFARYYLDVYNSALANGAVDVLAGLGTEGCETCSAFVSRIRKAYDAGGSIQGGRVKVLASSASEPLNGLPIAVEMKVSIGKERDLDREGNTTAQFPGEIATIVFLPRWERDAWSIDKLKLGVK